MKYTKKRITKKLYKKKANYKIAKLPLGKRPLVSNVGSPYKDVQYCKMLYTNDQIITLNAVASTPAVHVMRLNSLYDTDWTAGGHQPRGFDQLMAFYQHYTVLSVKGTVTFINNSTSILGMVGISAQQGASSKLYHYEYTEDPRCQYDFLGLEQATFMKRFNFSATIDKFFNTSTEEDNFKGTITTNPVNILYLHAWAMSTDRFTTSNISVEYSLEFNIKFSTPLQVPAS